MGNNDISNYTLFFWNSLAFGIIAAISTVWEEYYTRYRFVGVFELTAVGVVAALMVFSWLYAVLDLNLN